MMALTFAIGFVVAAIIKVIAYAADYFEFHRIYNDEIIRMKDIRKIRIKRLKKKLSEGHSLWIDSYHGASKGVANLNINEDFLHGVSKGRSNFDIINYYYPHLADTKEKSKRTNAIKE